VDPSAEREPIDPKRALIALAVLVNIVALSLLGFGEYRLANRDVRPVSTTPTAVVTTPVPVDVDTTPTTFYTPRTSPPNLTTTCAIDSYTWNQSRPPLSYPVIPSVVCTTTAQ
jgi:hypothetical protein